jgi:hypothetical protein
MQPVSPRWYDGDLNFVSGPETRKSRNPAENPACTISMNPEGVDLVFECRATRVTDKATLQTLAALFRRVDGRQR